MPDGHGDYGDRMTGHTEAAGGPAGEDIPTAGQTPGSENQNVTPGVAGHPAHGIPAADGSARVDGAFPLGADTGAGKTGGYDADGDEAGGTGADDGEPDGTDAEGDEAGATRAK